MKKMEPQKHRKKILTAWMILVCIVLVYLIGIFALSANLFKREIPCGWFCFRQMNTYTSSACILLAAILWYAWSKSKNFKLFFKNHGLAKIALINTAPLMLFLLIIGSISFSATIHSWLIFVIFALGVFLPYAQIHPLLKKALSDKDALFIQKENLYVMNKRFQAITNESAHAIISIDLKGIVKFFNPAAERMLGYSAKELVNKKSMEIFHDPQEVAEYANYLSKKLGQPIQPGLEAFTAKLQSEKLEEREWTYIRKGGMRIPVQVAITALHDADNNIYGYMAMAEDITERKHIETMKNEFISMVSHELRTPLTSILGSLSLLLSGVSGELPNKAKELLQIAKQNSERLTRLINDILDIEKIEAGKIEFYPTAIDLGTLLAEAIANNQAYADQYAVKLEIIPPLPKLILNIDKDRMMQVITNLLSNAIKYSDKKAPVTINAALKGNYLRIAITNTGEEIPQEFRKRIFNKFAQADSSSTRGKSGTGLGLSICKAIIEKMDGNIGFMSDPSQNLTTFYFELPEAVFAAPNNFFKPVKTYNNLPNILHVENENDLSLILGDLLQNKANIINAPSLQLAKKYLQAKKYDLVILDLKIPDGAATELIPDISKAQIPIIVFSAYELPEQYAKDVEVYLLKSKTSNEQLLKEISNTLLLGSRKIK